MNAASDSFQPLSGVLVLDFTTLLPGPLATLMMHRSGARVVKVERPGGDELRGYEPKLGDDSAYFAVLNEGKESLVVDLKTGDRTELDALVRECDVLVEQFRPDVMDRLGLGYDAVRTINPDIVYCSISGYGRAGPLAATAGHDLNYLAETGLLSLTATPALPPVLIADIGAAAQPAVLQVTLALLRRERTGEGARIDVSMARNLFSFLPYQLTRGFLTGDWPGPGDDFTTGRSPRYNLYAAADGRVVAVAALEDRFWGRLCELIEVNENATVEDVAERIARKPAAAWADLFEGEDVCTNVVRTLEEAVRNPQFADLFARPLRPALSLPELPLPVELSDAGRPVGAP